MQRDPPVWKSSSDPNVQNSDQLYLYNSFTKKKELFRPLSGRQIKWYSCGPTVYDESHMGHARCYISFDILRRVLQAYFNYDVTYCMNITDIDDKIIIKARQEHLYKEYLKANSDKEKVLNDIRAALQLTELKHQKEADKDKKEMYRKSVEKVSELLSNTNGHSTALDFITNAKDVLSAWLDKCNGKEISDNTIFSDLPSFYEGQFHDDMNNLNILPPTVLTRVSEHVPEIIEFIERIIKNGFAYASNGSVYFDTVEFDKSSKHYYAKLVPEAFGDSAALAEGEGALTDGNASEKKNTTDFALWKMSKPGEPSWDSPWGKGRPGWHIECSAMASTIFDAQMDIHSGGVDLKFPHHDNEIAQSEAAFGNSAWVNFFLHSGHLHIQGCKMSKSLKNFITIKEALAKYTARQIRVLFLLHSWKDTLDFSDHGMESAIALEKKLNEFFLKVKDCLRDIRVTDIKNLKKWRKEELALHNEFHEKKQLVHNALCDSVDTPEVMKELSSLISIVNSYLNENNSTVANYLLVREIAIYCTNLLRIFGVFEGSEASIGFQSSSGVLNLEETVMPYLNVFSKFRDDIRAEARTNKQTAILQLCDDIRDNTLPELGVRLEDRTNDKTVVKFCDKETLLKEREQKLMIAEAKRLRDLELKEAQRLKEAKMAVPPWELFIKETDKYSNFDEKGFPVLDQEGKELSKSAIKKLEKTYEQQKKSYETYMASKNAQRLE